MCIRDSHYHVRNEGRIVKRAVYIAIGIDMEGHKDVLGMYGVHENNSVNTLQRSFLPFFYDGQDLICDPADRAVRNFDIIQPVSYTHLPIKIVGDSHLK